MNWFQNRLIGVLELLTVRERIVALESWGWEHNDGQFRYDFKDNNGEVVAWIRDEVINAK